MSKINTELFVEQYNLIADAAVKMACAMTGYKEHQFTYIDVDETMVTVNFSLGWSCGDEDTDSVNVLYSSLEDDIELFIKKQEEKRIRLAKEEKERVRLNREKESKAKKLRTERQEKADYKRLHAKWGKQ